MIVLCAPPTGGAFGFKLNLLLKLRDVKSSPGSGGGGGGGGGDGEGTTKKEKINLLEYHPASCCLSVVVYV